MKHILYHHEEWETVTRIPINSWWDREIVYLYRGLLNRIEDVLLLGEDTDFFTELNIPIRGGIRDTSLERE